MGFGSNKIVEIQETCLALRTLRWIVSQQPDQSTNDLPHSDNKALTALSNSLSNEDKSRCLMLMDFRHEDAFSRALKHVKAVLLSPNNDRHLRTTLALTRCMRRGSGGAQIVLLDRVEVMLRARGALCHAQLQEQFPPAILKLPFTVNTHTTKLTVNMLSVPRHSSNCDEAFAKCAEGETGRADLQDLLQSAVQVLAEPTDRDRAEGGVLNTDESFSMIQELSEYIAALIFGVEMDACERVEVAVTLCEESWMIDSPRPVDLSSSVPAPITRRAAVQATLHLHLLVCLLDKHAGADGSPLRARRMWDSVLQYASFAFTKLVLCGAIEESKLYFSFLKDCGGVIDEAEMDKEEALNLSRVFRGCKDAIARLQGIYSAPSNTAGVVSSCLSRILQCQPQGRDSVPILCAPSAVIYNSVHRVCGDAAMCGWAGMGICATVLTDTLNAQLVLAACLSKALQEDCILSRRGGVRVGLASFPRSLSIVEALRAWAEADPLAAMSLVAGAASHRLSRIASEEKIMKEGEVEGTRGGEGVDEDFLLVSTTRLSKFVRDVAVLFKVSSVELLTLCSSAGCSADLTLEERGRPKSVSGSRTERYVEGIQLSLAQRVVLDPLGILHTAVFLGCLCEASEDSSVAEVFVASFSPIIFLFLIFV